MSKKQKIEHKSRGSILTTWSSSIKLSSKEFDMCIRDLDISLDDTHVHNCPAPVLSFSDLRLPSIFLRFLSERSFLKPTPLQSTTIPIFLSGRDMIAFSNIGSGFKLAYSLPLLLFCLEQQIKLPLESFEGPFGIIITPSKEKAESIFTFLSSFSNDIDNIGLGKIEIALISSGLDNNKIEEQESRVYNGCHIIVGTPGKISSYIHDGIVSLIQCRHIILHDADILFSRKEKQVIDIINAIHHEKQIITLSHTNTAQIKNFSNSLNFPIVFSIGKTLDSVDVIQEVEFIQEESKMFYLLECLQKTPPPVVIFCSHSLDIGNIYKFLLSKRCSVIAIHSVAQASSSLNMLKEGKTKIIITSDHFLNFKLDVDIKHVINYDLPKDIDVYLQRIKKTGNNGKTGLATTFIDNQSNIKLLLDLRALLKKYKQYIPPVLLGV